MRSTENRDELHMSAKPFDQFKIVAFGTAGEGKADDIRLVFTHRPEKVFFQVGQEKVGFTAMFFDIGNQAHDSHRVCDIQGCSFIYKETFHIKHSIQAKKREEISCLRRLNQ